MLCYYKLILIWISYAGIKFREEFFFAGLWFRDFFHNYEQRENIKGLVLSFVSRLSLWYCFDRTLQVFIRR